MLLRVVERLDHRFDRLELFLKLRYGLLGTVKMLPYRGHGTPRRFRLVGRVLEEQVIRAASREDDAFRNLRAMVRRFLTAEVPGARVRVRFEGRERLVIADDEGFFDACLEPSKPLPEDRQWHPVDLDLVWPTAEGQKETRATGWVLVPPSELRTGAFGVISDIDDTIVRTDATNVLRTLRLVLFSNAHTRLPFEGVAAFYRALHRGSEENGDNPIFYVSTGPWNLYDLLEDFMEIQDIPAGPIFLKDWGGIKDLLRGMNHRRHKIGVIREILDTHANLSFVLVGDSGQQDAETYGQIVREYPGRIRAVYIRDVRLKRRTQAVCDVADRLGSLGVPMLLVDDTVEAARHAAAAGLISPDALPGIRQDRSEDARRPLLGEQLRPRDV